jgi:dipicolinate synthase subunit B
VFKLLLQGKKIGFALTIKQISDTSILREIEKIMLAGAELYIILLEPPEKKEGIKNKFQSLFRQIHLEVIKKRSAKENSLTSADKMPGSLNYPFLDLLVVIPDSERFLIFLEQMVSEDQSYLPLVLVPALENEPTPSLNYISSLMKKKGIFFVPFGPVDQKQEKHTLLLSRLDLLTETCAAALEGHQLEPYTWENHIFPH